MKCECVSKGYLNGDLPKMWYEKKYRNNPCDHAYRNMNMKEYAC